MNKYKFFTLIILSISCITSCSYEKFTASQNEFNIIDNRKSNLEFYKKYSLLKKQEKWLEIIDLGKSTLLKENLNFYDKALINARMASCYFYIGQPDEALKAAQFSYENAQSITDPNLLGRSYYLISASYRALASQANNTKEKTTLSNLSFDWIKKAINLSKQPLINEFIRAKIYFNAGALEQDFRNNNKEAMKYFIEANKIFAKNSKSIDDYNRTMIRYIRCLLESGSINLASSEATKLRNSIDITTNSKTLVHLLQLQAKIALKQGFYHISENYIDEAIEIASSKSMDGDIERLKNLKLQVLSLIRTEK